MTESLAGRVHDLDGQANQVSEWLHAMTGSGRAGTLFVTDGPRSEVLRNVGSWPIASFAALPRHDRYWEESELNADIENLALMIRFGCRI